MPVTEVLDVRVLGFNLAEYLFLVVAILKKACIRALRIGARANYAGHFDVVVGALRLIRTDKATARFINIEPVAFVVDEFERGARD
jgi:hypothetical protein